MTSSWQLVLPEQLLAVGGISGTPIVLMAGVPRSAPAPLKLMSVSSNFTCEACAPVLERYLVSASRRMTRITSYELLLAPCGILSRGLTIPNQRMRTWQPIERECTHS